jgi:hypothetical protein
VTLLIRVDQLPSAPRVLSDRPNAPVPPAKALPPQVVYEQAVAMYSLAIQIELPSTAAAPKSPHRVRGGFPTWDL